MRPRARPGRLPVTEGVLAHQMPYLAIGSGGRSPTSAVSPQPTPTRPACSQAFELHFMTRLAERFRVYAINRAPRCRSASPWLAWRTSTPPPFGRSSPDQSTSSVCRREALWPSSSPPTTPTSCGVWSSSPAGTDSGPRLPQPRCATSPRHPRVAGVPLPGAVQGGLAGRRVTDRRAYVAPRSAAAADRTRPTWWPSLKPRTGSTSAIG